MATFHLALDAIDSDFTLATGYGHIVGMSLSEQGLRDQGFGSGTYTGNRLSTIEHDATGFNADCEPGWYRTPNGVQAARPMTAANAALETLKQAFRSLHSQLHGWSDGLDALSRGQPAEAVNTGHDFLFHAHEAAHIIGRDSTTYSQAQRIAWANSMATGAADVQSPQQFYQHVRDDIPTAPTVPKAWVRPADAVKVNLQDAVTISGNVPTSVDLANGGWIEDLTA